MEPLQKLSGGPRVGLPKNPILERAEAMADSNVSSAWLALPYTILVIFFICLYVIVWCAARILHVSVFSTTPMLILLACLVVFSPLVILLQEFVSSYLKIFQTVHALYFQDQMFSLIIEGENDGIWDWDIPNSKIYFSPRWQSMLGYNNNEVTQDPIEWFNLIHPDDLPTVEQRLDLHFSRSEASFHVEHRIRTVSGDYRWVLDRGHAVWDNHGKVIRMAGSMTDISSAKEVEAVLQGKQEELERANETVKQEKVKYAALLTSIGDGMIATDKGGKIMVMNPQAGTFLGVDVGNAVGRSFTDIIRIEEDKKEKTVPEEERPIMKTLLQSARITTTSYYYKRDGSKFPAAVTSSPVMLDGQTIGAVVVFRDITQEIAIDKTKTEFVSLASHQLRTPLSAIRWYAEMLKSQKLGALNDSQKSYVEEIYNSNKRMIDLVNALLNTSRIDLGTFAVEPEPTDFKEVSESVLHEMFVKIEESNLHVASSYQPGLPKINADTKLVRIIFQNLLSNAMKYTPHGGNVSLAITYDDKNVLINVTDTGVGIPVAVQDKIFTKLFRADNARIVESEGTGLGLYIVKAIVEKSGGRIWFKSEENKGTTFFVETPLKGMPKVEGTKDLV